VLFAIIFAFLAGRVRAGADPGLRTSATPAQTQPQTQPDTTVPDEQTPSQPYEQQQQPDFGTPDSDPPSTHVS
jgi:hypothetical protein